MVDVPSNEDAALRYVLGEFNDAELREFESRLATSAELQALVNELEAGVVAMANAAPCRRAPAEIWRLIEKAMVNANQPKLTFPSFRFGWLRNGWAMAVVCLIGWLFYAFAVNRDLTSVPEKSPVSQSEVAVANPVEPLSKPVAAKIEFSNMTNAAFELLQARTREIMELRGKIAQLETAKMQLSRSLAQQRTLLGESNRIKFYQLAATSTSGGIASPSPLSPGLQRAVFMALARELGWLTPDSSSTPQAAGKSPPGPVNIGGVDFIDLRPVSQSLVSQPQAQAGSSQPTGDNNTTAAAQVQPPARPPAESPAASPATTASDPTIPAFVSGDNLVVALDSTAVPAGSLVSLTVSDANQNQTGGNFVLGDNPAVVTVPFNSPGYAVAGLSIVTMSFQTPGGQTSTIQFFAPPATNP